MQIELNLEDCKKISGAVGGGGGDDLNPKPLKFIGIATNGNGWEPKRVSTKTSGSGLDPS
ncbi:hypothetical protein [Pseudoalteromonas rubra]|uniref:hypothetical protein n=1 Tax=Pseudoalteromonas rubra TaxID=43658 RepID=UPI000F76FCA4|nr:hypothetical protein [Pseudoalteromonas rubra]